MADPSLSSKQRSLVADAARDLDKAKMMRFDEKSGNFYCTELGRIASHFYIQYSSVETYNEMLKRHMNETEVIVSLTYYIYFYFFFLFLSLFLMTPYQAWPAWSPNQLGPLTFDAHTMDLNWVMSFQVCVYLTSSRPV